MPGFRLHEDGGGCGGDHDGRDDQRSTTPWETAKTTRVTAPVIRSAPRTSSRILFFFCATWSLRPRTAGDRAAAIRPTGTLTRNTARQLVNCTSTPPRTWPDTKPTLETAP